MYMKKEKAIFNCLIYIGIVMLIFFFICMILAFFNILCEPASWAGALGSLAAALVALWGTMGNDIQNKEKKYNDLSHEIKRLKKMHSELSVAEGYDPQEYLKKHPELSYVDSWYQHWHDLIPKLIELKNALEENDESCQALKDFIKYINDGNKRGLNDQLRVPLLKLRLIYKWKEEQLKDME